MYARIVLIPSFLAAARLCPMSSRKTVSCASTPRMSSASRKNLGSGFLRASYQPSPSRGEGEERERTATPRRSSRYTHQTIPSSSRSPYPSLLPLLLARLPLALREARKSRSVGRELSRCAALEWCPLGQSCWSRRQLCSVVRLREVRVQREEEDRKGGIRTSKPVDRFDDDWVRLSCGVHHQAP